MKLDHLTIDPARLEGGDWVTDIPDCGDLRIRTKGLRNVAWRKLQGKLLAAVPRAERRRLSTDAGDRIDLQCLIETCTLDWGNLDDGDGNPVVYDKATAYRLLADPRYRALRDACFYAAGIVADQDGEDREADRKNSSSVSGGPSPGDAIAPSSTISPSAEKNSP